MEILIVVIGLALSSFSTLVVSALLETSAAFLSDLAEEGSVRAERLFEARQDKENTWIAFNVFEIASVLLSSFGMALWLVGSGADRKGAALMFLGLFGAMVLLKVVAHAIGTRYSEHLFKLLSMAVPAILTAMSPFAFFVRPFIRVIEQEEQEEEAREELEVMVETALEEGALNDGEYRILTNIMRFSSVRVQDVMTPRTVLFGCDGSLSVGEAVKLNELQNFSRFPVWEQDEVDKICGYVLTRDILRAALAGRHKVQLKDLKREVYFIPDSSTLDEALEQFLQRRSHLFVVVDEHGGVEGIVTMEDLLETMLGQEIIDEADRVIDLRELAKQKRDRRIEGIAKATLTAGEE